MLDHACSAEAAQLVRQYKLHKLQAHSAYMRGQSQHASVLFDLAFHITKQLLIQHPPKQEHLEQCFIACMDCIDFHVHCEDRSCSYYLEETAQLLSQAIQSDAQNTIKTYALTIYVDVVRLAQEAGSACCHNNTQQLSTQFEQVWSTHKHLLEMQ